MHFFRSVAFLVTKPLAALPIAFVHFTTCFAAAGTVPRRGVGSGAGTTAVHAALASGRSTSPSR